MQLRAEEISSIIKKQIQSYERQSLTTETGTVLSIGDGIARIYGLEGVQSGELLEFPGGLMGLALNLEADNVGAALFGDVGAIKKARSSSARTASWTCRWARRSSDAWSTRSAFRSMARVRSRRRTSAASRSRRRASSPASPSRSRSRPASRRSTRWSRSAAVSASSSSATARPARPP